MGAFGQRLEFLHVQAQLLVDVADLVPQHRHADRAQENGQHGQAGGGVAGNASVHFFLVSDAKDNHFL